MSSAKRLSLIFMHHQSWMWGVPHPIASTKASERMSTCTLVYQNKFQPILRAISCSFRWSHTVWMKNCLYDQYLVISLPRLSIDHTNWLIQKTSDIEPTRNFLYHIMLSGHCKVIDDDVETLCHLNCMWKKGRKPCQSERFLVWKECLRRSL